MKATLVVVALVVGLCSGKSRDEWRQEALKRHNELREKHSAPPLVLDEKLNKFAEEHAIKMAEADEMFHSDSEYGENLYYAFKKKANKGGLEDKISGYEAVDDWYSEIKFYTDFETPDLDSFDDYSHFSTIVWKNTGKLGIDMASNAKSNIFVVAVYDPAGNILAPEEFIANVLPPKEENGATENSRNEALSSKKP